MNSCARLGWASGLPRLEFLRRRRVTPLMRAPSPQCRAPDPTAAGVEAAGAPITPLVTVSALQRGLRVPLNPELSLVSLCSAY